MSDTILVVDDEPQILMSVELVLKSEGFDHVITCQDSRHVAEILNTQRIGLVLLDINMPHFSGRELLPEIVNNHPDTSVIIITGKQEIETVVEFIKGGALDYLVKPIDRNRLVSAVAKAVEFSNVKEENFRLKQSLLSDKLQYPGAFFNIISQNPSIHSIFRYIEAIARSPLPILITGETGAGKELFAEAIHLASKRTGNLVKVNISGLDDQVLYDTLFGHKKGAFTGADTSRSGLVENAVGGTLFLDEIGDLSYDAQIKLLRLLQENQYYSLGSDMAREANTHFVVATHRDLEKLVRTDKFRTDLYYRLQSHKIQIPPLRRRSDDINLLLEYFLEESSQSMTKKKPSYPPELPLMLRNYHFPGNIRELRNMAFDAVSRHKGGLLSLSSFREKIKCFHTVQTADAQPPAEDQLHFPAKLPSLKSASRLLVKEALKRAEGNQALAAAMLGITRQALNKRLHQREEPECA